MGKHIGKRLTFLAVGIIVAVLLAGCQGPAGPAGPPGPKGDSGTAVAAAPAALSVSPSSIAEDTQVAITWMGAGFTPNDTVVVQMLADGSEILLAGGAVSAGGAFSIAQSFGRLSGAGARQPTVKAGVYTAIARDTKGMTAVTAVRITPKPTPTPAPRP